MILAGRSVHELEQAYRRRFRWALGLATLVCVVLIHWLPPSIVVDVLRRRQLGYLDARQVTARLAPRDRFPHAQIASEATRRRRAGALEWVLFTISDAPGGDPERPAPRPQRQPQVRIGELVEIPPAEIVIQLDESFAPRPTSLPESYAEDFAILEMVVPPYPPDLLAVGVEGLVTLRARIGPDGAVRQVTTVANETNLLCEETAREALLRWRFRPLRVRGQDIWFNVDVPFRFRMEE